MKSLFFTFIFLFFNSSCAKLHTTSKPELAPFVSDGCSLFPNGTLLTPNAWLSCCIEHDFAYWMGGTEEEKNLADKKLEVCVTQKGYPTTGRLMKFGTQTWGKNSYSTSFRWGYGWNAIRPYTPFSETEKEVIEKTLSSSEDLNFIVPWKK